MNTRRLRIVLFALVAVVQLAVAGGAIIRSELTLRTGEVFRFRIQPVDPVDAFRGRYVAIRFALDRAPAPDGLELGRRQRVFVPLRRDSDGFDDFGAATLDRPASDAYLRLTSGGVYPDEDGVGRVWLSLPFDRYYMDEDLAPEAERAVWNGARGEREASVTVRVRNGVGVIEDLFIDDVPIHRWLAENVHHQQ
jgi:uncharacterized membrane-anchored protein